jgi:hypothetical protein
MLNRSSLPRACALLSAALLSACGSQTDATPEQTPGSAPVTIVAPTATVLKPTPFVTSPPISLPNPPVLGGIDGVSGDARTGGKIIVVGWAVDALYGAPAARVEVVMNDKWTFSAVTGDARPDVASALNRNDARLSGWTSEIALGTLPPGEYTLGLLVFDVNGAPHQLDTRVPLAVVAADAPAAASNAPAAANTSASAGAVSGALEKVEGTPRPGWVVIMSGWAADGKSGKPAEKIDLLLNDTVVLTVKPSVDRPDIAEALKQDGALKSGFTGRMPLPEDLPEGKHTVSAVAYDAAGNKRTLDKPIEITVLPKL